MIVIKKNKFHLFYHNPVILQLWGTFLVQRALWAHATPLACVANIVKVCCKVKLTEHLYLLGRLNESRPRILGFGSPSGRKQEVVCVHIWALKLVGRIALGKILVR